MDLVNVDANRYSRQSHPRWLWDGRLTNSFPRTKNNFVVTTHTVEELNLDSQNGTRSASLVAFGDLYNHASAKSRSRQTSHSAGVTTNNHGDVRILPGDHAVFTEASTGQGTTAVHRRMEEKAIAPDSLNLDRRKLKVCPIIEGEECIRLLNLQHNLITQIQNMSNLQQLIFLDLYDNQIEEIRGLSNLYHLRVLMLGNNRIKKISKLENLKKLDVLDLHGNEIRKIENINHLSELRVLNLSRNMIIHVENLNGLDSLAELNVRYNQIVSVRDADALPCLQRLFLSFNNISSFEEIFCLAESSSLSEITLDGNPIAQESWYKQTVLRHMLQLRQLDMKRITEEERRTASALARKEEEKKRESHRLAVQKEKRRLAISNAARQWEFQQDRGSSVNEARQTVLEDNRTTCNPCEFSVSAAEQFPKELSRSPVNAIEKVYSGKKAPDDNNLVVKGDVTRSPEKLQGSTIQGMSVSEAYLAELDGNTFHLYGPGALDSLERSWNLQTAGIITTVSFKFMDFEDIVPILNKLKIKFPSISHLQFEETNLHTLQQFNALAHVRRLDQLTVRPQGNPIVNFTLWKYYVLFRLSHFGIQKINEAEVTANDLVMAERLFGILAYVASSEVPYSQLLSILGESRKKQLQYLIEGKIKKAGTVSEENNHCKRLGRERIGQAVLDCPSRDSLVERLEEQKRIKTFCQVCVQDLVKEAADISMKNDFLQKLWPQIFIELVKDTVIEMRNKSSYMKHCLQKVIDQN
ncbi:leucine-rich repeat-containing protein 49 [Protopterus annectens]|uniref:leucine-rich repeat-containing protein 49 n=1 Tax=Protopterus annectens TaxID=7888 RepID=UPI001CF957CE|nr:leucine-rich repeat-containing protein 49 [Protopterus annectens]